MQASDDVMIYASVICWVNIKVISNKTPIIYQMPHFILLDKK